MAVPYCRCNVYRLQTLIMLWVKRCYRRKDTFPQTSLFRWKSSSAKAHKDPNCRDIFCLAKKKRGNWIQPAAQMKTSTKQQNIGVPLIQSSQRCKFQLHMNEVQRHSGENPNKCHRCKYTSSQLLSGPLLQQHSPGERIHVYHIKIALARDRSLVLLDKKTPY